MVSCHASRLYGADTSWNTFTRHTQYNTSLNGDLFSSTSQSIMDLGTCKLASCFDDDQQYHSCWLCTMVLARKGVGAKKLHLRESCLRCKHNWTLLVNMVQNIGAKHLCRTLVQKKFSKWEHNWG